MPYELSRFNAIFKRNHQRYLWNTYSGALISLDDSAYEYIKTFRGINDGSTYFSTLIENGCIIAAGIDELGSVIIDEQTIMLNTSPIRIGFTIAPGLECNYHCYYCFENERTSYSRMSLETVDVIYNYICKCIANNPLLKKCQITWFGGEPLLYVDIIEILSEKLINFCESRGVSFYAGIITNGRYLSQENVAVLKKCRVTQAQITVDGLEELYCKNKGASRSDFYAVISNIKNAATFLKISVRINVDETSTCDEIQQLLHLLLVENMLDRKIKVHLGFIRKYSIPRLEECKNHGSYIHLEREFLKLFGSKYDIKSCGIPEIVRRTTSCLQVCSANSCIGPEGELYRCEHYFGNKNAVIGTVDSGRFYNEFDRRYFSFSHSKKCLKCSFFPVCLGGCLDDRINKRMIIDCKSYVESLIDIKLMELLQRDDTE